MNNISPEQPIISPSPQDAVPTKSSVIKNIEVVVISVILTAIIVGAGVYIWQKREMNFAKEQLQQQIATLNKKETTPLPSPTSSAFSSTNRITLLPQWTNATNTEFNVVGYNYNFTDPIKDAESVRAPITTIPYTNTRYGFSISLPFNPQWVDSSHTIAPYDENNNTAVFGPLSTVEGGGAARYHLFTILPHKTTANIISELTKKLNSYYPPTTPEIKETQINGMPAIAYSYSDGMGTTFFALQVVGATNNFELRASDWGVPWASDDKLPSYLENIAKTLQVSR